MQRLIYLKHKKIFRMFVKNIYFVIIYSVLFGHTSFKHACSGMLDYYCVVVHFICAQCSFRYLHNVLQLGNSPLGEVIWGWTLGKLL